MHRRSVGGAFFIGLFCAFMPVPSQMVLAALLAVAARCNLPISVALVWISNPLTIGPMFYFAYKLGAWLLGAEIVTGPWELSWQWFGSSFAAIWWPLTLGCLVCGWVSGVTGAVVSRLLWRFHVIRRWRQRRTRRLPKRVEPVEDAVAGTNGASFDTTWRAAPQPDSRPPP